MVDSQAPAGSATKFGEKKVENPSAIEASEQILANKPHGSKHMKRHLTLSGLLEDPQNGFWWDKIQQSLSSNPAYLMKQKEFS